MEPARSPRELDLCRPMNTQNPTFLSKLPAELRIQIYHEVLVPPNHLVLDRHMIAERTSLLQTCHQVREEATDIYFGNNNFCIVMNDLKRFEFGSRYFEMVGTENASKVSRLMIEFVFMTQYRPIALAFQRAIRALTFGLRNYYDDYMQTLLLETETMASNLGSRLASAGFRLECVQVGMSDSDKEALKSQPLLRVMLRPCIEHFSLCLGKCFN